MDVFAVILYFYGSFLLLCGVASRVFIGPKARTALISGGMSGSVSLVLAAISRYSPKVAIGSGMVVTLLLFGVFSWRAVVTFFALQERILEKEDYKPKAKAFLIISLMAVVSVFVFLLLMVSIFL